MKNFGSEYDKDIINLRTRLTEFYSRTATYSDFVEPNFKPAFWHPIKLVVLEYLNNDSACNILEFGAGRTGFGSYLGELRKQVIFDVQDITHLNQNYLVSQADHVYICDLTDIQSQYDVIFSTFVLEHITNPVTILNHLLKLLKPGGSLFIASPRYDLPFYLSPSAKHYSLRERIKIGLWLQWRRFQVRLKNQPDFLIHFDPALFYSPWFRDADAVHWVSLEDLKQYLPKQAMLSLIQIPVKGLYPTIWAKYMLLFVQITIDNTLDNLPANCL